jgi:Spy/CpxP family protein refolding chaperone
MKYVWLVVVLLLPLALLAQVDELATQESGVVVMQQPEGIQTAQIGPGPEALQAPDGEKRVLIRTMHGPGPDVAYRAMPNEGRWWKNSELVKQVGVSDAQVKQMEKIFQDNRIPLIDAKAELERQEARLEPLMESDSPDEKQIASQIDKVAMARAGLEKTHALMLLAIRRVLTLDQWKKLQAIQPMDGPMKVMMVAPPTHFKEMMRIPPPQHAPGGPAAQK